MLIKYNAELDAACVNIKPTTDIALKYNCILVNNLLRNDTDVTTFCVKDNLISC